MLKYPKGKTAMVRNTYLYISTENPLGANFDPPKNRLSQVKIVK